MVKKINSIQTNDASNFLNKTDYDTKIVETDGKIPNHDTCITTQEFNKLTSVNFIARLKEATFSN